VNLFDSGIKLILRKGHEEGIEKARRVGGVAQYRALALA
jgi:hypothetical protein